MAVKHKLRTAASAVIIHAIYACYLPFTNVIH